MVAIDTNRRTRQIRIDVGRGPKLISVATLVNPAGEEHKKREGSDMELIFL